MNALVIALLLALQGMPLGISGAAPNINGFSIQGSTVSLSSFKGTKNVLVVFYRTQA